MTEDMRERFVETLGNQIMLAVSCQWKPQILREKVDEKLRELWQAALSSAATSGTPDRCPLCESQVREIRLCLICDTSHKTELYSNRQCIAAGKPNFCSDPWHRGDSLSGKGEATSTLVTGPRPINKTAPELNYKDEIRQGLRKRCGHIAECDCTDGAFIPEASAPDRAEELARALDDEAERIVSNCACATQLDELRDEEHDTYRTMVLNVRSGLQRVASLLRREMAAAPPREEG